MKKILTFALVMALALALAVPCFASSVGLPRLPEGVMNYEWFVINAGGEVLALNYNFMLNNEEAGTVEIASVHFWELSSGVWVEDSYDMRWSVPTSEFEDLVSLGVYSTAGLCSNAVIWNTSSNDFKSVVEKFKEQISVASVVQVLVVGATAVVGLVFMWWGVRKLSAALFKAFRKGKVSI